MEEWKDIPTWNGVFQVSNYGRVYNTKTKRLLKCHVKKDDNYVEVVLYHNKRRELWRLNRLVATVWQRPLLKTEDAHHKNKFKWCNCIWNLQIKDKKQHTKEHKTGTHHSQQTKQRMSKAHKGKTGWWKGKQHSSQSIAKREETKKLRRQNKL